MSVWSGGAGVLAPALVLSLVVFFLPFRGANFSPSPLLFDPMAVVASDGCGGWFWFSEADAEGYALWFCELGFNKVSARVLR